MNYDQFKTTRSELLRENPAITDCAEMNLYGTLAVLAASMPPTTHEKIHRCHLAAEWASLFGLAEMSKRALISNGVRDSLARIFDYYASQGARAWLPIDAYPVFNELAAAAKLPVREYQTLPSPSWPDGPREDGVEIMLITNPMKPLGRWLSPRDVAALKFWLGANRRRRLLIDAVYTFGTTFHESTLELLRGGQALLLHSLTKGWLRPRLFGVALVPPDDFAALAPVFRQAPPPESSLAEARWLMTNHQAKPEQVRAAIDVANRNLREKHPRLFPAETDLDAVSYFHPIQKSWTALRAEDRLLGIPATIFGSKREDITILSSLSFIKELQMITAATSA